MRAVIQRVRRARVVIDDMEHSSIGSGILVLLGVQKDDGIDDAKFLARKIVELRIFEDDTGRMNRSVGEVAGSVLAVSQFTLAGDCSRGRRPSFDTAAKPDIARPLYEAFIKEVETLGISVATGVFQAMMQIELTNDGPVTFVLDSRA
jgi:D-tyrosyl-tRNA(Tyr) deacylase